MQTRATQPATGDQEARIQRLLQSFTTDPTDLRAFRTLEEHLFLQGSWRELAGVYECRLGVLPATGSDRADLLGRLANVLADRVGDLTAARARYEEMVRLQPQNAIAISALRKLLTGAGELTSALQLAELEEALPLAAKPRARLLAEIGELWRGVGDVAEARARFAASLELDPACDAALGSAAALAESLGNADEAVGLCERRLETASGPARAEILEKLARLLPPSASARARALLEELVRAFPERRGPLEQLIALERGAGRIARVGELQRGLWKLVLDPVERLRLATEAAGLQLDEAGGVAAAEFWCESANEIAPNDASVQKLRLRVYRRTGNAKRVLDALEKLVVAEGSSPMRLLEVAVLHEREGRAERAIEWLEKLLSRDPYDAEALAILERCLARLGRHGECAEVLERRATAAESNEAAADLMVELGDLHLVALSDLGSAEAAYRRALEQVPGHTNAALQLRELLRKSERFAELASLLEEIAKAAPAGAVQAKLFCELAGLRLEQLDDDATARRAFEAALESDPSCAVALSGLRELAEQTREPGALLEACARELALEPPAERAVELLEEQARAALELGDLPRARASVARWVELDPGPASLGLAAELARGAADAPAEAASLEALEALVQQVPRAHALVCVRLGELAIGRPEVEALDAAAHWYRRALESAPADGALRTRLAELYRRTGNLPELVEQLRAALAAAGATPPLELALELARALGEIGNLREACSVLQPAFEREPESGAAGDLLESLLAEQDRIEELCDVLARRLTRERDPARRRELAHRQAGLLLEGLHRPSDAVAALREFADPTRDGRLEHLFARALDASGARAELETWLEMREAHVDGPERADLRLRLAALKEQDGRPTEAIACLQRALRDAPPSSAEVVRAGLLGLLRAHGSGEEQRAFVDELIEATPDPAVRAALLIERARLFAEKLHEPARALADLERAQADVRLGPDELRLVASLCAAAGAAEKQGQALARLAEATPDSAERRTTLLQLARLCSEGPDPGRSAARAEETLERLLVLDPADADAFDQLAGLYERANRGAELRRLLAERLAQPVLRPNERNPLSLRLAQLQIDASEARLAVETLVDARARAGTSDPALDELLFRALAAADNASGQVQLCSERVRASDGAERALWLRRWLRALENAGEAPASRLAVIDRLLADFAGDPELIAARVPLLRELGATEPLAQALERALAARSQGSPAQRTLLVRELLRLYEGPLARPDLALALVERELASDPGLRERGLVAARALGDAARELALLRPLVPAGLEGALRHDLLRRLGLALAMAGESGTAYTILRRAQALVPRDREVLAALESHARSSRDDAQLAELLSARFPLESGEPRQRIAAEAAAVAARSGDAQGELIWLRKLHALAPLGREGATRWLALERSVGAPLGRLDALRALQALTRDPAEQAELEAAEGEVLVECGQLADASACYARALAGRRKPMLAWLRAQSELLARLGRATERVDLLRMLASHPEAAPAERARHQRERIELLASHPELREEAALELRMLIDSDASAARPAQLERMRGLLRLYQDLGRDAEWCALAERVHALSPEADRPALEREIAQRLGRSLGSTEQAIAAWQRVLLRAPDDAAALGGLCELLRRPGDEARRADMLERLAATGAPGREHHWLEAARLRWLSLADARSALADVEHALALSPHLDGAHDLRSELCANLDRHTEEAASLRELLAAEPEGPQAADRWLRLAQLAAARAGSEAEAIGAAERSLALARGQLSMVREARRVFERAQAWERVRDLLREEIESAGQTEAPALLRRLARVAWDELHDAELACEALAAVESSETLRTDDRERYAAALAERGLFAESFREREKVLAGIGDLATAANWLALARDVLQRFDDPRWARELCDRALAREPRLLAALELRIELHARLCEPARELEDVLAVAELETGAVEAATRFTRAAEIARHRLADETRAAALFHSALKRDPAHLPALLGAGEIALARGEWPEAERTLGLATTLLPGTPEAARLGAVSRAAARAALAQQRHAEAYRYLELALAQEPEDPEALDAMATQALRLGAYERARDSIDRRLRRADLAPEEHADRLVKLAQACEGLQQLDRAAAALEEVLAIRPDDEVSRARAVDLLERLGESERAVLQLDAWSERAPAEFAARLRVRAAQLELAAGDRGRARARLEAITEADGAPDDAWTARLEIARADDGPEPTLVLAERAIASVRAPRARAAMLWLAAEANLALGRNAPAARRACDTLGCDPGHVPAARLLASQLGQLEDWGQAVKLLERTLDVAHPEPSVEAELWEAVGRAYAGPLEDIERAQRCYRRALECNPLRSSTREALADITAFDPASHRESVAAHRELLARHPARRGSWRSLERIAEHWKRERAQVSCAAVLQALGTAGSTAARPQPLLADASASTDPSIAAATELLLALAEAGGAAPSPSGPANAPKLQGALKREVDAITGAAWALPDASLRGIWSQPADDSAHSGEDLGRRARKRLKRALRSFDAELLRVLEPEAWREQVLGQAAAKLVTTGAVDLRELLLELLECWPATAQLQLRNNGDLAAGIQLCPPARTLLLRISSATIAALGL